MALIWSSLVGSQVFESLDGLHQISDIIIVTNKRLQCVSQEMCHRPPSLKYTRHGMQL